jgi:hypothetical protein
MNTEMSVAKPSHTTLSRFVECTYQARNSPDKIIYLLPRFLPILLFMATSSAVGADVSGKWNGALEVGGGNGQTQRLPAHADLKQQNNVVTGKVWKEVSLQSEIEQGQVSGNEISFRFSAPEGEDEEMLIHTVKLTLVSPTEMRGTLEFSAGGQKFRGNLTFIREK